MSRNSFSDLEANTCLINLNGYCCEATIESFKLLSKMEYTGDISTWDTNDYFIIKNHKIYVCHQKPRMPMTSIKDKHFFAKKNCKFKHSMLGILVLKQKILNLFKQRRIA